MSRREPDRPAFGPQAPLASVRPDWADWHVAHVAMVDLRDVHWDHVAGHPPGDSPDPVLFGFTRCDAVVAGDLPHSHLGGNHPHDLRVCILREDNDRVVFDRLALEAGTRPHARRPRSRGSEDVRT
ncbi:MAG: hypothetical protein ACE148_06345 [Vicinamibacterales bacterium]